ncbi:MAG: flagellar hook-associated protein 3 FlgL [Steroidobacteraceae bacterium]|jgi:flagellar hook-associated protein 3 FlgL|nr:flagellar hook-associated protein 3 FlgL [Steroidobacteraceae bacterium]
MRISTAGMHRASIGAILENQTRLSKTQTQVATGKKFQTAAEDPIGATRVAGLQRKLADNTQYERNSNIIKSRLSYEEQTLADITSVLQSARDSALAGANATLGQQERAMLANQVRQNLAALMEMANRQDANGEYLFAGTTSATRPFSWDASGVNYQGDQVARQIRISSTQSLADVHTGVDAFMGIAERNGVFRTTVSAGNTGDATIGLGTVTDPSAWVADNYTLQFTSPSDWQVVDDSSPTPVVIASGSGFASGQNISFQGISVTITGTPAANDSFEIAPAQNTDVFSMLDELARTLEGDGAIAGSNPEFLTQIGASIANLDAGLDRVVSVRAEVGTRLQAIDIAADFRDSEEVDLQALVSSLRDVDYAAAISQLNQQYTSLQAAQAAYSKFAQLSLFNYL